MVEQITNQNRQGNYNDFQFNFILCPPKLQIPLQINKMESKIRPVEELNKEIADTKNVLNKNEGILKNQTRKYSTPQKKGPSIQNYSASTQHQTPELTTKREDYNQKNIYDEQMTNYIKNLKKLCTSLQQKSYALQVDYRKNLVTYQFKQEQLQSEVGVLNSKLKQVSKELSEKERQVSQLSKVNKQKQAQILRINEQLSVLRNENVKVKIENKTYKADNKVIMNHIQRLQNEKKNPKDNRNSLEERQYRVMQSLYLMNPNPNYQLTQSMKRHNASSELSNRVKLDQSVQANADLKSLIRRLNEEIQILKRQKESLLQQCKNRTQNLEAQKLVAKMKEESNEKLNILIMKMGDKIMKLQEYNQSLRKEIVKLETPDENQEDSYYRTTKTKIGQFYYKK